MDPVVLFDIDSIHTRHSLSVLAEDAAPDRRWERPGDSQGRPMAGRHLRLSAIG
jgi:hypothetical protein